MAERILIVEDKENLRYDLSRLVNEARPGSDVVQENNETEAIRLINKVLFGLILADIHLEEAGGSPEGGFEVLKAAKEREPNTQVIVITSFPSPEHIDRIRKLGALNYIDRNTSYFHDLLVREVGHALRLFEYRQQQNRHALVLSLPERDGGAPRIQLLPRDLGPREARRPFTLNLHLLKGTAAAIGSLVYLDEPEQRNALSQFVGRQVWDQLFRDDEVLLLALGEAQGLVRYPTDLHLRILSTSDALDLPLELLHDGREYLALRHPFVRVIRDARPMSPLLPTLLEDLRDQGKSLRILLLASDTCSSELGPIPGVDQEVDTICKVIEKLRPLPFGPEIEVNTLHSWESTRERVLKELKSGYHLIHYAGHGIYDERHPGNSKLCLWESPCQPGSWDDMSKKLERWYFVTGSERHRVVAATAQGLRGKLHNVTTTELANCFAQSTPSLVYLSCCHSARSGGAQHLVFSKSLGLMEALVRMGVPIAVGHRWPLVDGESSVRFVETFYEKLLAEFSPEQALFWARKAVEQDDPTWASAVMVVQSS